MACDRRKATCGRSTGLPQAMQVVAAGCVDDRGNAVRRASGMCMHAYHCAMAGSGVRDTLSGRGESAVPCRHRCRAPQGGEGGGRGRGSWGPPREAVDLPVLSTACYSNVARRSDGAGSAAHCCC